MASKISLVKKNSLESFDSGIFPEEYYDIPGVCEYRDIESVKNYACDKLQIYRNQPVELYINGGMAIELLAALQAAAILEMEITVCHRDFDTGVYYQQPVTWRPGDCAVSASETLFALCNGRHVTAAKKFVFEKVPTERLFDFKWQEETAMQTLSPYRHKSIKIYLTGLKPLCISTLNVAYRLGISVIWLHYDCDREEYFSQRMD